MHKKAGKNGRDRVSCRVHSTGGDKSLHVGLYWDSLPSETVRSIDEAAQSAKSAKSNLPKGQGGAICDAKVETNIRKKASAFKRVEFELAFVAVAKSESFHIHWRTHALKRAIARSSQGTAELIVERKKSGSLSLSHI